MAATQPLEMYLKPQQVAKLLNLKYRTILEWIKMGNIGAIDISPNGIRANYRIPVSEYHRYMKEHSKDMKKKVVGSIMEKH